MARSAVLLVMALVAIAAGRAGALRLQQAPAPGGLDLASVLNQTLAAVQPLVQPIVSAVNASLAGGGNATAGGLGGLGARNTTAGPAAAGLPGLNASVLNQTAAAAAGFFQNLTQGAAAGAGQGAGQGAAGPAPAKSGAQQALDANSPFKSGAAAASAGSLVSGLAAAALAALML